MELSLGCFPGGLVVFELTIILTPQVVELSDVCSMATDVSAGACCASLADLGVRVMGRWRCARVIMVRSMSNVKGHIFLVLGETRRLWSVQSRVTSANAEIFARVS